jgi:hypothetical protein
MVRAVGLEEACMVPWLKFLIAFIVFCHGFVYLRIGSQLPAPVPAWRGTSLLLGNAVAGDTLRMFVVTVHVLAGVATLACAFAIGFASSIPGWWRPLGLASGLLGIAAFAIFWDGQTKLLFEEGILGAVLSAGLLAMAILLPAAFR